MRSFEMRTRLLVAIAVVGILSFGPNNELAGLAADEMTAVSHISSSNGGPSPFSGININQFLGATRFYNAGYDGTGVRLANIEAGHVDSNHSTLTHVTTRITGTGAVGTVQSHATNSTSAMAGRISGQFPGTYFEQGIASGATTYSGAIATSFGAGNAFNLTNASTASVYSAMIQTGTGLPGGQTVDVFNSSWGFTDPTGFNQLTAGVDGLINNTGVVSVFSAGNSGPGANTVGGIGAGYNSITVGALGSDQANPAYNTVSTFSSRGPNDFFNPQTGTLIPAATSQRAAVDISAPGQNLTLATAGGNPNLYAVNAAGTSFAAPLVAGGAALVVDAGKDLYGGGTSIDGRVVKAVLLNSADKTAGWSNGLAANNSGVQTTTQSLDFNVGAGRMNLDAAFDQFVNTTNGGMAGTTDLTSGNEISNVGWDFGNVAAGGSQNYFITDLLAGGSTFKSTLTWFADRNPGALNNFNGTSELHFANLDLSVFQYDGPLTKNILSTVAQSISMFNLVEHLTFNLSATGYYGLRVSYTGALWNFNGQTSESYGLAWSSASAAVPEPSTTAALMLFCGVWMWRRRSARQTDSLTHAEGCSIPE